MANDRLRDALMAARVTHEDLAADLGVNTKTVERWITQARLPVPAVPAPDLRPGARRTRRGCGRTATRASGAGRSASQEIVHVYPYRADVPRELWARLFENATENIGILVYSGFFLPEQHASHIQLLKQKADDGASIRILLGDPDSPQVALKGQEEDIGDAIAAKIRNVLLAYYVPFASHPGITIKLHATTLYNSIFWFDDDMLVNTHAYGVPAHFAPVLHLRHLSSGTLFQTYARSFDRVWDQTRTIWTGQKVTHDG